ncbi:Predicted PurR-regulated permease PerM [Albimonas donghaensis]|uniref:Predicted PurR-regulated permease PerM n=1 Tax=Albimonas donghaensis TaxID=356660 RepID=A0A1H3DJ12_9RHOB|nr:AI-2E family transporter [Albimonas donghaensis]SDX66310.1 Predicted PurR-regulated permease PerM [Albimonas donghaensis]
MSTPADPTRQRVVTLSVDVFVTLGVLALFMTFSFRLIAPFASILIWSVILAVALAPAFDWLNARMGGKRGRTATVMALVGLVIVIGPTVMIANSLIDSVGQMVAHLSDGALRLPAPPETVRDWPLIGAKLFDIWRQASVDLLSLSAQYGPKIRDFAATLAGAGAGVMIGVLQFAVSVIFAAVFLAWAGPLGEATDRVAGRISGRGRTMTAMASKTIQNVSRGVIGVAIVQGGLAAIGIIVAGLPLGGFLAAAAVLACVIQMPPLVIIPLIILDWAINPTLHAVLFTAFMLPVLFLDNVLKPILMARGLTTPMVVIMIGVIGGTLSMGLLGLFIGPVILALFYEMVQTWIAYESEGLDPVDETLPGADAPPTQAG